MTGQARNMRVTPAIENREYLDPELQIVRVRLGGARGQRLI
jgi:hypothetical protein